MIFSVDATSNYSLDTVGEAYRRYSIHVSSKYDVIYLCSLRLVYYAKKILCDAIRASMADYRRIKFPHPGQISPSSFEQ